MFPAVDGRGGWEASAKTWIAAQGEEGDWLRRWVLDGPMLELCLSSVDAPCILDLGCGEGRFARKLASRGARVIGMDPVPQLLRHARAAAGAHHIDYVLGVGEALPFRGEAFDVVLSYITIVDIPDFRAAIHEMARVVRPGGQVVVATMSPFASSTSGWVKSEAGEKLYFPIDDYLGEFAQELAWKGIRIVNYHRPMSALMDAFLSCGLILRKFLEPRPVAGAPEQEAADYVRVPYATVLVWEKP